MAKKTKVTTKRSAKPKSAPKKPVVPQVQPPEVLPEAPAPPKVSVADLLKASLVAHEKSKALRKAKDKPAAKEALTTARDLRIQAVRADPERKDPAWEEEAKRTPFGVNTHEALMVFYHSQLGDE